MSHPKNPRVSYKRNPPIHRRNYLFLFTLILAFGLSTTAFSRVRPTINTGTAAMQKEETKKMKKTKKDDFSTKKKNKSSTTTKSRKEKMELPTGDLNINTATMEELKTLPGIGDALASKIIEYRNTHGNIKSLEELEGIEGIGPKTIEKIRERIKFW